MSDVDADVPEAGAVFTFGKSRFGDNLTGRFWIKNDKVLQVVAGDEHSAIVTESGRLYTFGANEWGQLGLGHTKSVNKPTCVKALKQEGVVQIACGRYHTVVCTRNGRLYTFGAGAEGQLGHGVSQGSDTAQLVESLPPQKYKMLSAGTDHTAALTAEGRLYIWGGSGEGQLGLGHDVTEVNEPTELKINGAKITYVSCGYDHTAVITDDGKLYTFGDTEGGKLGLSDRQNENHRQPQPVLSLKEKAKKVSCGGSHTAVITESGKLYTFGYGDNGQLGQGPSHLELSTPQEVVRIDQKCTDVSCGQNHTAVIVGKGELYTFGDGRHGKLGQGDEATCNLYLPFRVARLKLFKVIQVSSGGCHMLSIVEKRALTNGEASESSRDEDPFKPSPHRGEGGGGGGGPFVPSLTSFESRLGEDQPDSRNSTLSEPSARNRRRLRDTGDLPPPLARTLPPLGGSRPLPSLGGSGGDGQLGQTDGGIPRGHNLKPIDFGRIPEIKLSAEEKKKKEEAARKKEAAAKKRLQEESSEEEDSEEEDSEEEDSEEENGNNIKKDHLDSKKEEMVTKRPEISSKGKKGVGKKVVRKKILNSEDEEESVESEQESEGETMKKGSKTRPVKGKGKQKESEEDEESDDDDDFFSKKPTKMTAAKAKNKKKMFESEEEDEEEDSEEEEKTRNKKPPPKSTKKKKLIEEEEEEDDDDSDEESEEEIKPSKKGKADENKKSKDKKPSKKKAVSDEDDDEEDEDEDEEESEEEKVNQKNKKGKKNESKESVQSESGSKSWMFWKKSNTSSGSNKPEDAKKEEEKKKKEPANSEPAKSKTCTIL